MRVRYIVRNLKHHTSYGYFKTFEEAKNRVEYLMDIHKLPISYFEIIKEETMEEVIWRQYEK